MIVVGVAFVAVILILLTRFPLLGFGNADFGPGWDCALTPSSESVCIKKVPKLPAAPARSG